MGVAPGPLRSVVSQGEGTRATAATPGWAALYEYFQLYGGAHAAPSPPRNP